MGKVKIQRTPKDFSEDKLDAIPIVDIERYLRKKKLEKINKK
jgi:hypothetical protein